MIVSRHPPPAKPLYVDPSVPPDVRAAVVAFGHWGDCATAPLAFLRRLHRASFSHPALLDVPALHVARATAYEALCDLSAALRHLEEAARLIAKDEPCATSTYITRRAAAIAYALAATARHSDGDPVKCLALLAKVADPEYRTAVAFQTASCILELGDRDTALVMFADLAHATADPDLHAVCARLHAAAGQLPSVFITLQRIAEIDPHHPSLPALRELIAARVRALQIDAAKLAYQRHHAATLDVVHQGLELAPDDVELMYYKAEALQGMGRAQDLLAFLATCPAPMRAEERYHRIHVTTLELLVKMHWSCQQYPAAIDAATALLATRTSPVARDRFWRAELHYLASGARSDAALADFEAYLAATPPSDYELDRILAESRLCTMYTARATPLAAPHRPPGDWRAALRWLDRAIPLAWPRPATDQPETDPEEDTVIKLTTVPWISTRPAPPSIDPPPETHRAALWFAKAALLARLAETDRAAAAARAALRIAPGMIEAKSLLLELTGDQDELAALAAAQVAASIRPGDGIKLPPATLATAGAAPQPLLSVARPGVVPVAVQRSRRGPVPEQRLVEPVQDDSAALDVEDAMAVVMGAAAAAAAASTVAMTKKGQQGQLAHALPYDLLESILVLAESRAVVAASSGVARDAIVDSNVYQTWFMRAITTTLLVRSGANGRKVLQSHDPTRRTIMPFVWFLTHCIPGYTSSTQRHNDDRALLSAEPFRHPFSPTIISHIYRRNQKLPESISAAIRSFPDFPYGTGPLRDLVGFRAVPEGLSLIHFLMHAGDLDAMFACLDHLVALFPDSLLTKRVKLKTWSRFWLYGGGSYVRAPDLIERLMGGDYGIDCDELMEWFSTGDITSIFLCSLQDQHRPSELGPRVFDWLTGKGWILDRDVFPRLSNVLQGI
ncbi:p23 chaperone protein wos2 [Blastocladiella emersonii ATCC 22665]|nr:p23 chaperone protein wos2 [Blastocladiella emersonii ATCC 22665]